MIHPAKHTNTIPATMIHPAKHTNTVPATMIHPAKHTGTRRQTAATAVYLNLWSDVMAAGLLAHRTPVCGNTTTTLDTFESNSRGNTNE